MPPHISASPRSARPRCGSVKVVEAEGGPDHLESMGCDLVNPDVGGRVLESFE